MYLLLTLDILHTFNILRKCMSLQYSTYFKIQWNEVKHITMHAWSSKANLMFDLPPVTLMLW